MWVERLPSTASPTWFLSLVVNVAVPEVVLDSVGASPLGSVLELVRVDERVAGILGEGMLAGRGQAGGLVARSALFKCWGRRMACRIRFRGAFRSPAVGVRPPGISFNSQGSDRIGGRPSRPWAPSVRCGDRT